MATVAAAAAAVLCLVLGGVGYLDYINEQQISYLEASTSYGECKQVLLPDGTQLVLTPAPAFAIPTALRATNAGWSSKVRATFGSSQREAAVHCQYPSFRRSCIGTCFDIKAYLSDEVVSVDVESGKVQVDLPEA